MKNLILEEISRISELMGINNKLISEQWWKAIASKVVGTSLQDVINAADRVLGKTITKLEDLTELEIKQLLKGLGKGEARTLKSAFVDAVSSEIGMTVQKFESKTVEALGDELLDAGLDPQEASNYIKWFKGKTGAKPLEVTVDATDVAMSDIATKTATEMIEDLSKVIGRKAASDFKSALDLLGTPEKINVGNPLQDIAPNVGDTTNQQQPKPKPNTGGADLNNLPTP